MMEAEAQLYIFLKKLLIFPIKHLLFLAEFYIINYVISTRYQ